MTTQWHQHSMRVQYKDTDQMGVVHHGNYITWFEVGRTEWMRYFDISYHDMEAIGLLLPVVDVQASYKQSAHFDEPVVIFSKLANFSPIRMEFDYEARKITEVEFTSMQNNKVSMVNEPYGKLLTKGSTTHMWVNKNWKPAKLTKTHPTLYQKIEQMMYS
ncbi:MULTISPECIES: acyl-CoA thioesterase [Virgibacillus]|uniref:Acyl-CoA thioesterase YbgC n=1 Tax=Virgibacillus massiliensis TaxID=1462526 RepID=A0A024Q7S5_9BACI|nr:MULTISPECIES: thioesterase family protein [Virgibacillus]EQB37965.1 hypothetical protein M948_05195 [Virgibacillus sp. CM-4]MYL40684.1 YbgC/FadM family acyl-CoA thioesterase [Virgibacillus massiliensis]CDQ38519.1 acyl-CoA thioesterase YbgC [Virgibacillus massiliensis]